MTEIEKAKHYLYKLLAMKSWHSVELQKKLKKYELSSEEISNLIEEVEKLGYINDDEWLASFIRGQTAKKISPRMITCKLRQRGVSFDPELVKGTMESESLQISALLKTKYKNRDLKDYKESRKVYASLARKGFSHQAILSEIKK